MKITIKKEYEVTSKMICDHIITAFEGGSNYWIESVNLVKGETEVNPWYSDPKLFDQIDFLVDIRVEDEERKWELTKVELSMGLNLMAKKSFVHFEDLVNETGDVITADIFLQYCLFGDIIYG